MFSFCSDAAGVSPAGTMHAAVLDIVSLIKSVITSSLKAKL